MTICEKIKKAISENDLSRALDLFKQTEIDENHLINLIARFNGLQKELQEGIITSEAYRVEIAKFRKSLIAYHNEYCKQNDYSEQESPSKRSTDKDKNEQNMYYEDGYALFIGIAYEHWGERCGYLPGPLKDVKHLNEHFLDSKKAAYNPQNIIICTEKQATRTGILKAFDELIHQTKNKPNASVIIHYSGHGETKGVDTFLLPHNFDVDSWRKDKSFDKDNIVLSNEFAEKIAQVHAKKVLVILDCCHSENMATTRGVETGFLSKFVEDIEDNFFPSSIQSRNTATNKILNQGEGRVILTSCRANEQSIDLKNGGLFTEVLLQSLNGKNNLKKDGKVRLIDLIDYVPKEVARRAKEYKKEDGTFFNQTPMFKKIENLSAEEFIICAYDINKIRGIGDNPEKKETMEKEAFKPVLKDKIIALIESDIDKALEILDDIFKTTNGTYNGLNDKYLNTENINMKTFRSQLKRFVRTNL